MAARVAEARRKVGEPGFKTYMLSLLTEKPELDPESVFVRLAMDPGLRAVANHYFGMYTRLQGFNVWRNFRCRAAPRYSQLWHRDPEDLLIFKAFVYLEEVDLDAGALQYAPGTHAYGRVRTLPESNEEPETGGRRSTDEQMERVVPRERWALADGPPGTIVFVDTTGYHKGGWATERERLVYLCTYCSDVSRFDEYFERSRPLDFHSHGGSARYALGG